MVIFRSRATLPDVKSLAVIHPASAACFGRWVGRWVGNRRRVALAAASRAAGPTEWHEDPVDAAGKLPQPVTVVGSPCSLKTEWYVDGMGSPHPSGAATTVLRLSRTSVRGSAEAVDSESEDNAKGMSGFGSTFSPRSNGNRGQNTFSDIQLESLILAQNERWRRA